MPRSKKRTPRKSSLSNEESEDAPVAQEFNKDVLEQTDMSQQKQGDQTSNREEMEVESVEQQEHPEEKMQKPEEPSKNQDARKTESEDKVSKSGKENQEDSTKKEVTLEDLPVTPYLPHKIPNIVDSKLKEKWEWHMRIYPIDHSDIRRCVLDSVSKIAQETWYYIDKNNYGMGSYDLCLRSFTDTAMVMLKTLRAPMLYRYVTVEVSRRGKSTAEINKIKQNPPLAREGSNQDETEDLEDRIEEAIDNLPYTEVVESATLHLDYCHTIQCDKIKGKEKKRSLYVKYLPESTSKELLKVLFPVAINLDIISTEAGRRVGDLDVVSEDNLRGVIQAYVAVYINGCKTIGFAWKEEDLDDGKTNPVSEQESPWELLPRDDEIAYEAVSMIETDSTVQFRKEKREMEIQQRRGAETQNRRNRGERRRESRWESDSGTLPPEAAEMIELQRAMNAKIENQLALLQAVGDRSSRSPGGPGMIRALPDHPPALMDSPVVRDRKRDRFERDRMDIEMGGRQRDFPQFGPGRMVPRMAPPEQDLRGRPDFMARDRDRMFEGSRGPLMGMYGGGRFGRGGPERAHEFGRRFGSGDTRRRGFDYDAREGFENVGRGRGRFDSRGGGSGEASGQRGFGRGNVQDHAKDQGDKTRKGQNQAKETGSVDRPENREQKSADKGGGRSKPVAHGFPASIDQQGGSSRAFTPVALSSNSEGSNKSSGQEYSPRQGGLGNRNNQNSRGNNYTNQRGNSVESKFHQGQDQKNSFGSQGQRGFGGGQRGFGGGHKGFGGNQNQQNSFGSQSQQQNFGSPQNRQGNFGGFQNQSQGFGNSQMQSSFGSSQAQNRFGNSQMQNSFGSSQSQQRGYGGSQTQQTNFGSSGYQQSGYGSAGNQGNYGAIENQATSYSSENQMNIYNSSYNQQNSFGLSTNQQSLGTSQNQQSSYSSSQQSAYGNQQSNYGSAQNASDQQSGYSSLQSQGYNNQQSYGTPQQSSNSYGNYNNQQPGYNPMQQQNYSTSQSYDSQQQTFGGQGYGTQQQQQMGYSTGGSYDWNQQAPATNTTNSATSNYSQSSLGSGQQTQQQDYSSYSTAYPGYGGAALPSAATGYGADTAFANQGLYSASQGSQSLDPYGNYSGVDSYGTSNQQSMLGGYNYSQYQGNAQ